MIRSLFGGKKQLLSDGELVEGIRKGDDKAFRVLYSTAFPSVKSFVLNNNGKEADAEDVLQDGMVALWDNVKQDKFILQDGVKVSSYLIKICKYRWLDRLKSADYKLSVALNPTIDNEDSGSNVLNELISSEEIAQFEGRFGKLGEKCQTILKLYYYEKKSMAEIAELLQMQPSSVKNEKYRCMEKLKTFFDNTI